MENITTIQLREKVKSQLDNLKQGKESYEDTILRLMLTAEQCLRSNKELLIEQCQVMAEDDLKIVKEWEATDATLDWECNNLIPEKYLKTKK